MAHKDNKPLKNFDEIVRYAHQIAIYYARNFIFNLSDEDREDYAQDCILMLCKYREKAEREISYTGQVHYWMWRIMKAVRVGYFSVASSNTTKKGERLSARHIPYDSSESDWESGYTDKTNGGILEQMELKENLYYLNIMLEKEREFTQKHKLPRNRFKVLMLKSMGYTEKEIVEIIGGNISDGSLRGYVMNARNHINELRVKNDKSKDDLQSLWLHKKLLAHLGDKEELSIYRNFSTDEILAYCDKMVERIKNLPDEQS